MTKFPHDEFAKEYLSELCKDYGKVESDKLIRSEGRRVDILFSIEKDPPFSTTLGLLGKLLQQKTCFSYIAIPYKQKFDV